MHEKSDVQLLRDYAESGSEPAFRELVRRHTDFVYSAALRQVESPDLACDIAQSVFTDLARKAGALSERAAANSSLAGWLHRSTRYAALNHLRDSRRRFANERQAMEQLLTDSESTADWEQIGPALDEALDSLSDEDREALLLRYFKNHDFRAVGLALGVSDDTAQKRVSRAVERLREFFSKRNIAVGASGLAMLISANAVQSAPATLISQILASTLTSATITTTTIAATKAIAMTTLQKTIVTATIAVLAGAGIYETRQAAQLREQNQTLQQQQAPLTEQLQRLQQERDSTVKQLALLSSKPAPRLPAPRVQASVPTNVSVEDLQSTNVYARFKDKPPKLSAAQIEAYLKTNGRKATSLLAAYRTSGDSALLKEAMEKYPDNPQVAFEAAFNQNLSADQHRHWLNTFKQTAPNNSLANYLSAVDSFNSGQIDQGIEELVVASGKPSLQNYTLDRWKDDEEAYLSAGYSAVEAKYLATTELQLPQLAPVRKLGQNLVDLANAYQQTGDHASAQAALQMAMDLGQRYVPASAGDAMISQLVGLVVQRDALRAMDPNSPYGNTGQTVDDQLNQVEQQRAALKQLGQQAGNLLETMPDPEWINYLDRWIIFGDASAAQWLVNKYGRQ